MTTTSVEDSAPSDRPRTVEHYWRRMAEDFPQGEFLRGMRDLTRAMMGLEPLCTDCQEESEAEDEESADSEKD